MSSALPDQEALPVRLTGVGVRYGVAPALAEVDLDVGDGERVALLGRSGAGKSTLLRLLTGAVRPSAGAVSVLGTDVAQAGPRQLRAVRRQIGIVAQGLHLAGPLRVAHNVSAARLGAISTPRALLALTGRRSDPDVLAALDAVDLGGFAWRRTDELSGGEQQRVAVARVILQRPALVLADEPVSSLDPGLGESIVSQIAALTRPEVGARAVVMSLHDPELARRFCDRLVGLAAGRIVFDVAAGDLDDGLLDLVYRPGR